MIFKVILRIRLAHILKSLSAANLAGSYTKFGYNPTYINLPASFISNNEKKKKKYTRNKIKL